MTALPYIDILPSFDAVRIVNIRVTTDNHILIVCEPARPNVACPKCACLSQKIHSKRLRTLHDLPCFGRPVELLLSCRCFRCENLDCECKYFTEQFPGLSVRYGRRTCRAQDCLVAMGVECGGEAAERLGSIIGLFWSADSFLRAVRRQPGPEIPTDLTVLGVDDWAMRKGQRYGTLCYDVKNHRPVALLPDREAPTLTKWLTERPILPAIVTRDGSQTYRGAIDQGDPDAMQVADRFHIKHNFLDAVDDCVKRLLHKHPPEMNLKPATDSEIGSSPNDNDEVMSNTLARRKALWEHVHQLSTQGMTRRAIAIKLGISRSTVTKYLQSGIPVEQRWSHRKLDPFLAYLKSRWESGCHNAKQLFEEIQALGFKGKYSQMAAQLSTWRESAPKVKSVQSTSVREWVKRWVRKDDKLEPETQGELTSWVDSEPSVKEAYELTREFEHLFDTRDINRLKIWLSKADESNVPELRSFAHGLQRDEKAVTAALMENWSNGPVEAAVNSLKTVKRQMFGRGKLDLLEKRYLYLAVRRNAEERRTQSTQSSHVPQVPVSSG